MTKDTWNTWMAAGPRDGDRASRPAGWSTTDRSHDGADSRETFSATGTNHKNPPARVYALSGVFTDCKPAYAFLEQVRKQIDESEAAIVIDLADVTQMTSCGVGILAAAYNAARDAERAIALVGMGRRLVSVMRAVGLLSVIPSYETRSDALEALAK